MRKGLKRVLAGFLSCIMVILMLPNLVVFGQETNITTTLLSEAYSEDIQSKLLGIEQAFSVGNDYLELPNELSELDFPDNKPQINMEDMKELPSEQMLYNKPLNNISIDIERYTVLVLDTSSSSSFVGADGQVFYTADTAISEVKASAKKFVKDIQSANGTNYVAIVSYKGSTATIASHFTTNEQELMTSIDRLYASSNTRSVEAGFNVANNLIDGISNPEAMKNVVLFTTGMTNEGNYSYYGHYNETTIGSRWIRMDTNINLYAYANAAYSAASSLKSRSTVYTIGLFNTIDDMPSQGRDVVQFFKLSTLDWATSSKYFYDVKDPNDLEFVFGEIAKDITDYKINFNYKSGDSRDFTETCYFSHDYFKNKSITGYDPSLSTASLCFALSCFASNEQEYTKQFVNAEDFLTKLDFKDFDKNWWFTQKPQSDSIGVVAANKKITVNKDEEYTLIACGVRGGGYESEWAGNFTLGRTGNHAGFETARDQVIKFLKSYISNNKITGKVKLWIVGYSRAGATANMVAGAIDDGISLGDSIILEKGDLYAYTFETPQGASKDNLSNSVTYNNIYNIINRNDPVPRVAMTGLGFTRYGNDKFLPALSTDGIYYINKQKAMLDFYNVMDSYIEVGEYNIDNFEFLECKLKYILPGGKDFIQVKDAIPQDYYLDGLMNIVVKEAIKTRDYYADELEEGIGVIFKSMYETLFIDEPISRINETKDIFVNKLCQWNTVRDMALIIFINDNNYAIKEYIACLLIESFQEASIDKYNMFSLNKFADEICKLVIPLALKHPNYTYTTIKNLDKITASHNPELCFAWLKSQDINYTNTPAKFNGVGQYRIIRINCPVDLKVFNSSNILLSHIESDIVQDIPNSYISSYINQDGEKIVCLPANEDFSIEIIPTDNGVMNYSVNEYSSSKDDYSRIMNYYDIAINKGQTLSAFVPAFSVEELNNYTDGSSTLYSLVDSSGSIVMPNLDLKGDKAANAYYLVSVEAEKEEQGIVIGQGIRNEGAFAQVEAVAYEGYEFIGWYEDGITLISEDAEFRFPVKNDINLVAKFEYIDTESKDIEVTFDVISKWDRAFSANITIRNISDKIIDNWAIQFDMPYEITSIWNGTVSSGEDGIYIIRNAGYNQDINPGRSVTIGFIANTTDEDIVCPNSYTIVGKPSQVILDKYEIDFKVTSDWKSGYNGQLIIKNVSDEIIEDWILEFDFAHDITTFWTADIISHIGEHYIIKNKGYNSNIKPGQSIILGFAGNPGNVIVELKDYELYYIDLDKK